MSRETTFFAQGFVEKLGALKGEAVRRCQSELAAIRTARSLGETRAGAVAFSSSGDSDTGEYDETPIVLWTIGRLPDEFGQ
jgi:hypothetical protein